MKKQSWAGKYAGHGTGMGKVLFVATVHGHPEHHGREIMVEMTPGEARQAAQGLMEYAYKVAMENRREGREHSPAERGPWAFIEYRCRDIGNGVEYGNVEGYFLTSPEFDEGGKRTFVKDDGERLYLFPDEIVTHEVWNTATKRWDRVSVQPYQGHTNETDKAFIRGMLS